jgi:hypothetical protein
MDGAHAIWAGACGGVTQVACNLGLQEALWQRAASSMVYLSREQGRR